MTPDTIPPLSAHPVLLRLPQVKARTDLSRSELYRRIDIGIFPAPIKIGERASACAWECGVECFAGHALACTR